MNLTASTVPSTEPTFNHYLPTTTSEVDDNHAKTTSDAAKSFTHTESSTAVSNDDISDVSAAIGALLRVSGLNNELENHGEVVRALIDVANGRTETFRASHAILGIALSDEVAPPRAGLSAKEKKRSDKKFAQRFHRAWEPFKKAQAKKGCWLCKVQSGGKDEQGQNQESHVWVDLPIFTRTIELARKAIAKDIAKEYPRHRHFEKAAETALAAKERDFTTTADPYSAQRPPDDPKAKYRRFLSSTKAFARKAISEGVKLGNDFESLKKALTKEINRAIELEQFDSYQRDPTNPPGTVLSSGFDERATDSEESVLYTGYSNLKGGNYIGDEHLPLPCDPNRDLELSDGGRESQEAIRGVPVDADAELDEPGLHDAGTLADSHLAGIDDAQQMLECFVANGAKAFDLVVLGIVPFDGGRPEKIHFVAGLSAEEARKQLPVLLAGANFYDGSLVVTPLDGKGTALIQLDDLDISKLTAVEPFSFLTIETSPGRFHAWVAITGVESEQQKADLRQRLIKGAGGDKNASGKSRIAGSLNAKEKHRQADGTFPRVKLQRACRLITTSEALESAGLLAAPEPKPEKLLRFSGAKKTPKSFPDYQKSIAAVRRKDDGTIDRSAVDYHHSCVCLNWGFSFDETVAHLQQVSEKASGRGDYAQRTVAVAARRVAIAA